MHCWTTTSPPWERGLDHALYPLQKERPLSLKVVLALEIRNHHHHLQPRGTTTSIRREKLAVMEVTLQIYVTLLSGCRFTTGSTRQLKGRVAALTYACTNMVVRRLNTGAEVLGRRPASPGIRHQYLWAWTLLNANEHAHSFPWA